MSTPVYQVDAFTDRAFAGNPAAVCLLNQTYSDEWMQSVSAEMNLSETAFVRRLDDDFGLRWFTPKVEVDLCGHATLASAHTLWTTGYADAGQPIRFHTRSGVLTCRKEGEWIELDFPAQPATSAASSPRLIEALGVQPTFVGTSKFDTLVVVEEEDTVRNLQPTFSILRTLHGVRGVIVTSPSTDNRFDFVSRFFAPAAGIDEDPVTGSAHCCLAPYWAARLGKLSMTGFQASARAGVVRVRIDGERVKLCGQAVMVLRGELLNV